MSHIWCIAHNVDKARLCAMSQSFYLSSKKSCLQNPRMIQSVILGKTIRCFKLLVQGSLQLQVHDTKSFSYLVAIKGDILVDICIFSLFLKVSVV